MSSPKKRFRVAFSFAGGKRDFVEEVAAILAGRFGGEKILYDKYHEAEFARRDLGIYLPQLYHEQSDLVVVVLCADYEAKQWTGLEWTAIHDLLSHRKDQEVMLCRFDHATVPGLYSTAGFVELDGKTPQELATLILQRLALNEGCPIDHYLHRPARDDGSPIDPRLAPPTVEGTARDLVYISYRHRDKHWHRLLRQILNADPDLKDRIWDDTDIHEGDFFADEIDRHVARARVMIMLTSADYFGPECGAAECEIKPALEAHAAGLLKILWIPVRRHNYGATPIGRITAATGAGAIALEDLSPVEQMDALYRAHEEVRRCLGLPVKAKPKPQVITGVELVMDRSPAHFDETAFRQALEGLMGVAVHRVQIVSIREGSTIVALGGDPEALAVAVRNLRDSQDTLRTFVQTTGLQSFSWVADGQTFAVQVSSLIPKKPPVDSSEGPRRLVILIHGIRTRAEWEGRIRSLLEKYPATLVETLGYGYFDVLRFLFPFFTRQAPVKEITEKVRGALHYHQGKFDEVIIVGHSFASYIIGTMLRKNPTIEIDRVLLCGSVLRRDYPWDLLPNRPKKVLNEVGSKDIWPILAHSVTWGFGSSGTFGFQTFGVRDRYHALKHSDYFKVGFAEKFWIPWILEGTDVSSSYEAGERPATPFFKNLIDIIHLKWIAIMAVCLAIILGSKGCNSVTDPSALKWRRIEPGKVPEDLAEEKGTVSGTALSAPQMQQLERLRNGYPFQRNYVSFLSDTFCPGGAMQSLRVRPESGGDLAIAALLLREEGKRLERVASLKFAPALSFGEEFASLSRTDRRRLLVLLFPLSSHGDAMLNTMASPHEVLRFSSTAPKEIEASYSRMFGSLQIPAILYFTDKFANWSETVPTEESALEGTHTDFTLDPYNFNHTLNTWRETVFAKSAILRNQPAEEVRQHFAAFMRANSPPVEDGQPAREAEKEPAPRWYDPTSPLWLGVFPNEAEGLRVARYVADRTHFHDNVPKATLEADGKLLERLFQVEEPAGWKELTGDANGGEPVPTGALRQFGTRWLQKRSLETGFLFLVLEPAALNSDKEWKLHYKVRKHPAAWSKLAKPEELGSDSELQEVTLGAIHQPLLILLSVYHKDADGFEASYLTSRIYPEDVESESGVKISVRQPGRREAADRIIQFPFGWYAQ